MPEEHSEHSLERRAGWALFWNTLFLPLKAVLSLVVALVIVRLFPREIYVVLAALAALQSTFGLFIDLGIERALPRFVGQIERQRGRGALRRFLLTITLIKLGVLAGFTVLLAALAEPLVSWFNLGDQGRVYLALVAVMLVLGALYDICTQVLYSFFKQKVTNLLDIVVTVLNPLLTLALIVWPWQLEVYGVMLALLATTVISVAIAAWQAVRAAREAVNLAQQDRARIAAAAAGQPELPVNPAATQAATESLRRRFVRYAALMYFFSISAWFYDAAFAILVFKFFNELLTVALIRLSYSFIKQLLKTLLTPFQGVQTPLFSSIHAEGRPEKLQAAYSSISKLQIFILVPAAAGAILLSRNLVELLFASQRAEAALTYHDLGLAAWVTALTVAFTFTEALISLPMLILQVYERYRLVIISRTLPLLGGGLLILAAAWHFDVIAAVIIMGSMAVGSRVIAMLAVRRSLGLLYPAPFFWKVLKAALAFAVPLALPALLLPVSWPLTVFIAGAGALIFLVAFQRLGGFDAEDKNRLLNLKLPFRKYIVRWL